MRRIDKRESISWSLRMRFIFTFLGKYIVGGWIYNTFIFEWGKKLIKNLIKLKISSHSRRLSLSRRSSKNWILWMTLKMQRRPYFTDNLAAKNTVNTDINFQEWDSLKWLVRSLSNGKGSSCKKKWTYTINMLLKGIFRKPKNNNHSQKPRNKKRKNKSNLRME